MVSRNRLVINGTIAGGLENWSCSIDYVVSGGGSVINPSEVQAWAEEAAGFLDGAEVALPNISAMMGANVNATQVLTYGYGDTGPAVATGSADTSWLGSTTIKVPFSTAVCVTKRSLLAGRRNRGRFYWPALGITITSSGKFVPPSALASEFATLIEECGRLGSTDLLVPVIYSKVGDSVTALTSVAVGDVPDSQRGRRDSLVETYQTAAISG